MILSGTESGGFQVGAAPLLARAPKVFTLAGISLSRTKVSLAAAIDPYGQTTDFRFQLGAASSSWCKSGGSSGSPESTSPLFELLYTGEKLAIVEVVRLGLTGGEEYCYDVLAENAGGTTRGEQVRFTAGAPTVETLKATSIGPVSARIVGEIDAASQQTYYHAEYGLAGSIWCRTKGASGSAEGSSNVAELSYRGEEFTEVGVDLSGLTPGSEYCAELVAKNGTSSSQGSQVTFRTEAAPHAITLKALGTGTTTATVEGEIDPDGQSARYDVEYAQASSEWCTTGGNSGSSSTSAQETLPYTDNVMHPVKVELSKLSPGTEYCGDLVAIGKSALSSRPMKFKTDPNLELTVSLTGTGSGTVSGPSIACPGSCTGSYEPGSEVALSATPAAGSTFAGWGGACTGTGACKVTLSANEDVTATFTAIPAPAGSPGGGATSSGTAPSVGETPQSGGSTGAGGAPHGAVLGFHAVRSLLLTGRKIVVERDGTALIGLKCKGGTSCHGKLTITTKRTFKIKGKRTSRTVTIAVLRVAVAAGKSITAKVKLRAVGRKLLRAAKGRLRALLELLGQEHTAPTRAQLHDVRLVELRARRN